MQRKEDIFLRQVGFKLERLLDSRAIIASIFFNYEKINTD